MFANLGEFVVVFGLSCVGLVLASAPLRRMGIPETDYRRRAYLWLLVVLITFFANNFWLFVTATSLLLTIGRKRDPSALALFCFLLVAAPPFKLALPGFAGINALLDVHYYRLLVIFVLVPAAFALVAQKHERRRGIRSVDLAVVVFILWMFILEAADSRSVTISLRFIIGLFLDVWIPYYVASRAITTPSELSNVLASLLAGIFVISLVAMFESLRSWQLYEGISGAWGLPAPWMSQFMTRGVLRSKATPYDSIALGYTFMIGLALAVLLLRRSELKWRNRLISMAMLGGLISTVSRGPWVGAAMMLLSLVVIGPHKTKRLIFASLAGAAVVAGVLVSPLGDTVVAYLPFVGSVETSTIDHRERLIDITIEVAGDNFWAGDIDFLENPRFQEISQGGFIDIVNTYAQIVLPYGMVGLFTFCMIFAISGLGLYRAHRRVAHDPQAEFTGRVLIAILTGIIVTIGTVSSVSVIPMLYWLFIGIACAYSSMYRKEKARARGAAGLKRGLPAHGTNAIGS